MGTVGWTSAGPFVLRAGALCWSPCPLHSTTSAGLQGPAVRCGNHGLASELAGNGCVQLQVLLGERCEKTQMVLEAAPSPGAPSATPLLPLLRPAQCCPLLPPPHSVLRTGLSPGIPWGPLYCVIMEREEPV